LADCAAQHNHSIQTSAAHTGTCADPAAALEHLLETMVRAEVGIDEK